MGLARAESPQTLSLPRPEMAEQDYPPPSAPPRGNVVGPQPPPPSYNDVLEHDRHRPVGRGARVANTLTSSMAFAGEPKTIIHLRISTRILCGLFHLARSFSGKILQCAR